VFEEVAFDRELATRFSVKAVELIAEDKFGDVAAIEHGKIIGKPIEKPSRSSSSSARRGARPHGQASASSSAAERHRP